MRVIHILSFITAILLTSGVQARSFTADAIQVRDGEFSHARMFWADGNVRFEYLDNGVPMVQIYDLKNKKTIWLDTENKLYAESKLASDNMIDPMLKENKTSSNPCDIFKQAECTKLKETSINGRKAVKWLITKQAYGMDQHIFQWLDKKYKVVLRQENPDGSLMEVHIDDGQELNGRKVRKLSIAIDSNGQRSTGTQWYDNELNIIVRQLYQNGAEDELRNIKIEKVGKDMFAIPKGYKLYDTEALASEPNSSDINRAKGPVNN